MSSPAADGATLAPPPAVAARAWLVLCGLLAALAGAGWLLPAAGLDWQPGLAFSEPWRAFSAAGVHWSERHLVANLLALAVVAVLGWQLRLPTLAALAWVLAWPLTHLGLLLRPELAHYGGLSGVLHAGVAVVACWTLCVSSSEPAGRTRRFTLLVLAGLVAKLLWERPWGPTLTHPAGWDIAVAPLAHACGAVAGAACGTAAGLWAAARARAAAATAARKISA